MSPNDNATNSCSGKKSFLSPLSSPELASYLRGLGREIIFVDNRNDVSKEISNHPDIAMCKLGTSDDSIIVRADDGELEKGHPKEAAFDAACTGKFFIHSLRHTSPKLLDEAKKQGMTLIDVKQSYAKCSIVIVDEASIITYDNGIAATCKTRGDIDVLLVSPGHVFLPGYATGFIGGTSGRVENKIIFNGDLTKHPDYEAIRVFIKSKNLECISIGSYQLTDIGSII